MSKNAEFEQAVRNMRAFQKTPPKAKTVSVVKETERAEKIVDDFLNPPPPVEDGRQLNLFDTAPEAPDKKKFESFIDRMK